MPDKKRYEIGQIVFLEEDGEMKTYKIMAKFDLFQTYMLKSCENPLKTVEVHENQLRCVEEHNAIVVDGKAIADLLRYTNNTVHDLFSELSDEELDYLAPPVDDTKTSYDQETYRLMYDAIGSAKNIMSAILHCATSENKLSDAELLAMRDRAEEFGCAEIVYMIDGYFEEGEEDE